MREKKKKHKMKKREKRRKGKRRRKKKQKNAQEVNCLGVQLSSKPCIQFYQHIFNRNIPSMAALGLRMLQLRYSQVHVLHKDRNKI